MRDSLHDESSLYSLYNRLWWSFICAVAHKLLTQVMAPGPSCPLCERFLIQLNPA